MKKITKFLAVSFAVSAMALCFNATVFAQERTDFNI